jgi:hypothetical protein
LGANGVTGGAVEERGGHIGLDKPGRDPWSHGSHGGRGPVPGLRTLVGYRAAWLPRDLVAWLVLAALLIPAGAPPPTVGTAVDA